MGIREWQPSKENTQQSVDLLADLLRETGLPDIVLGAGVLWFHVVAGGILVLILLFFPCNTMFYFLCVFLWNLVIVSNVYYHGCILSRLERELFHLDGWFGPVSLMNKAMTVTKDIANFVIKFFFAVPVSVLVVFRFVWNRDTLGVIWPIFLGTFYTAIATSRSQDFFVGMIMDKLEEWETKIGDDEQDE